MQYYTFNSATLPLSFSWRTAGVTWFAKLRRIAKVIFYKLTRSRDPAYFGTARPDRSNVVELDELPEECRSAIDAIVPLVENVGFRVALYASGANIGGKSSFTVALLDTRSTTVGLVTWIKMAHAGLIISRTVFSCISICFSGEIVNTGNVPDSEWIPEMVPPKFHFVRTKGDGSPSSIMDAHQKEIRNHDRELITLTDENLVDLLLSVENRIFDHAISIGAYSLLTEREVQRLTGSSH